MTPEIVRRFVGGRWRTIEADASTNGGSQIVGVATKTLTSAQIKALHASAVVLDGGAAPGVGKGYLVLGVQSQAFPGGTPYTVPDNARLEVGPKAAVDGDWSTWETQKETDLQPGTDRALNGDGGGDNVGTGWAQTQPAGSTTLTPPDLIENQPLAIGNPGDEFPDGDGTLYIAVAYAIVDVVS